MGPSLNTQLTQIDLSSKFKTKAPPFNFVSEKGSEIDAFENRSSKIYERLAMFLTQNILNDKNRPKGSYQVVEIEL